VRDTYCVPSLVDQQDNGANVTAANEEPTEASAGPTSAAGPSFGQMSGNGAVRSVLVLGLLAVGACWY
jgi:hypothetical protein